MPDPRRKRLLYTSQHRGMREMDLVLGGFARAHVPSMTEEDLTCFEELLAFSDRELYGLIFEGKACLEEHLRGMVKAIRMQCSSVAV